MEIIEMYENGCKNYSIFIDFKNQKWFFPSIDVDVDYRDHKSYINLDGRFFEDIEREYNVKLYKSDFNQYEAVDRNCEKMFVNFDLNEQDLVIIKNQIEEYVFENIENFIDEDQDEDYEDYNPEFDRDFDFEY